eukprot:PhM_4_TR15039/c0_g1_i1/m.61517
MSLSSFFPTPTGDEKGWPALLMNQHVDGVKFRPGDAIIEHCLMRCIQTTSIATVAGTAVGWCGYQKYRYPHRTLDLAQLFHVVGRASVWGTVSGVGLGVAMLTYMSKDWTVMDVRARYITLSLNRDQELWTRTEARGAVCGTLTSVILHEGALPVRVCAGIGLGSAIAVLVSLSELDRSLAYLTGHR